MKSPFFLKYVLKEWGGCPVFLEGLPCNFWILKVWMCYSNMVAPCSISAACTLWAALCILTGYVGNVETESTGGLANKALWWSRGKKKKKPLGEHCGPRIAHAGQNSLSSMNHKFSWIKFHGLRFKADERGMMKVRGC